MSLRQHTVITNNRIGGRLEGWKWGKAATAVTLALFGAATSATFAQSVTAAGAQSPADTVPFSLGKVFTFLFLTLGPFNVLTPFAAMTRGRDAAFKRRLALAAFIIATFAVLIAATEGARTLQAWGISFGALQVTAGLVLFLVALQPILKQYERRVARADTSASATTPTSSVSSLAFSPLAFPTIVTPYGIAVVIMLLTLRPLDAGGLKILGVAVFVLALDLVAMLLADWIMKVPFIGTALGILGSVMGVLQIALGVQAVVNGLRALGIVGAGRV